MTKSELMAKKWLISQGYSGITFQGRHSPDFLTSCGKGFEVKMARQNVIVFSPRQWGELASHGNVDILIYDDSPEPLEIIPFTQLSKPPSYYKNYRLTLVDIATRRQTASSQRLREIRTASGLTITAFAKQLGVSFQSVSRWEKGILKPSHLASEKIKRFEKLQNIIFADKDNTEE